MTHLSVTTGTTSAPTRRLNFSQGHAGILHETTKRDRSTMPRSSQARSHDPAGQHLDRNFSGESFARRSIEFLFDGGRHPLVSSRVQLQRPPTARFSAERFRTLITVEARRILSAPHEGPLVRRKGDGPFGAQALNPPFTSETRSNSVSYLRTFPLPTISNLLYGVAHAPVEGRFLPF